MNKNAGFGVVGIVLAVAVVGLVGFIGWRLYDTNKTQQNNSTNQADQASITPAENNTPDSSQADAATYLDIKELGVKIKLSDDIKDLTYSAQTLSDGSKTARFSTKTLASVDPNCDASFGPLGSLEMTTVDTDRTGAKKVVDNVGIFKLGDYYISYSSSQALCSDKVSGITGQPSSAFREALKTMQLDQ